MLRILHLFYEILLGSEQLQNMILLYLDIILYTRKTCYCSHDVRPTTHMTVEMLKGKIHRATVVQAELDYVGSITVDEDLLEAAGIMEYEKVQIVDVNNGSRFETYTICGKRGSGMICLNGAAARCVSTGDKIIIMCYAHYDSEEAKEHKPQVVFVDDENKISRVTNYEKHGLLKDMA